MNLGRKITLAKQAIDSLLDHDDEPVAARAEAAEMLTEHIDTKMTAATKREAERIAKSLVDPTLEPTPEA